VSFSHEVADDATVLRWEGKLGADEQAEIRRLFWQWFTLDTMALVIVDLSVSERLDASTISLLVGAHNLATKEKSLLRLVNASPENQTLLEELSLDQYFQIHTTTARARADRAS